MKRIDMLRFSSLAITAALLGLAACNKAPDTAATTNVLEPAAQAVASTKWNETVSKTADGGMLMGNPDAKVKLIEYGALSCSHCAEFSEKSHSEITAMVAKGTLSFEFRPFLLNALDVPASLLVRCGGAGPSFPVTQQLYAAQAEWLGKTKDISAADQKAFETMPQTAQMSFLAEKLGLISFVQARGIGAEQAKACLNDTKAVEELGKISEVAQSKYKLTGTPTFVLNGQTVPDTSTWELLKPKLLAAGA
jgi:protein-disulfide isomerase